MYYNRTTLYRILDTFLRHKWLFVITLVTIMALVAAYTMTKKTQYTTVYTVLVNRQIQSPLGSDVEDPNDDITKIIGNLSTMVLNQEFLQAALTGPDGQPIPLEHPIDLRDPAAIVSLKNAINISEDDPTRFDVSIVWEDAADSKVILQNIITKYVQRDAEDRASFYTQQKTFIQQQVDNYQTLLNNAENRLADFRRANLQHMPGQSEQTESTLASLKTQAADLQVQIATEQDRVQHLAEEAETTPKTIVMDQKTELVNSPLQAQLDQLNQQLAEDMQTMTASHPVVIDLRQRISIIKAQIKAEHNSTGQSSDVEPNPLYQSLTNQKVETTIDLHALQMQLAEVNKQIAATTMVAQTIPNTDKQLAELTRDYSIYSDTYATLKSQLQAAQLNEEINIGHADSQYEPYLTVDAQSSASKKKVIAMYVGGLILALFLASALVLLAEFSDRSFRDPADAERVLGLPVLAVLPEIAAPPSPSDMRQRLLVSPDGQGPARKPRLLAKPDVAAPPVSASSGIEPGASGTGWSTFQSTGGGPKGTGS